jgi:hypothetical protein
MFDLDHVGSPIGEDCTRSGNQPVEGDLYYTDAFHDLRHVIPPLVQLTLG